MDFWVHLTAVLQQEKSTDKHWCLWAHSLVGSQTFDTIILFFKYKKLGSK